MNRDARRFSIGIVLSVLLLGAGVSCNVTASEGEGQHAFRFAVMADCQTTPETRGVYSEATLESIDDANLLDPDFGIIVGDLICGYQDDREVIEKERDAFDELVKRFTVPVYFLPGNHDSWSQMAEDIYLEHHGKLYYSFDHEGSHFILLDSVKQGEVNRIDGEQLGWLKEDLEKHKDAEHIFVFLHKPLWQQEQGEGTPERGEPRSNWAADVHPLLAKHGVDSVFSGHLHHYEKCETKDGVRYIVVGTMGAPRGNIDLAGEFLHTLFVSVRGDEVKLAVVRTGSVKPEDYVTTELRREVNETVAQLSQGHVVRLAMEDRDKPYRETITRMVRNPFEHEIRLKGKWDLPSALWRVEPAEVALTIAAGETRELLFDLSAEPGAFERAPTFSGSVEVAPGRPELPFGWRVSISSTAEARRMARPIAADGDLSDWFDLKPGEPAVKMEGERNVVQGKENWEGKPDLSAHVYLGKAEDGICVVAKVWDEDLVAGPAGNFREGDALFIYFSAKPPRRGTDPNRIAIRPAIGERGTDVNFKGTLSSLAEKIEVGTTSDEEGYSVEVKIPKEAARELLGAWEEGAFLFDVTVADFDGEPGAYKISRHGWTGEAGASGDPLGFGEVLLTGGRPRGRS